MSYQVLARKWRPKSFIDVVGQQHVLTVLANALSLGRVHHAYLFSGTRGVGKTSIARLLAKGLNCEQGITATPCGECDNCKDIEQGRFIDLLEIDAASRTKVEDTREILDNIQYLPTKGRFKVYLIDEVHMLSRSSFNALLKTLEEPPEHVKFLLATTDPQKLPVTILSRCLHLHLSVLDSSLIKQQLLKILKAEHINTDDKAIQLLAKAANGSMRDALSLTDQAIALGNGQIDGQSVSVMLGTLDKAVPFDLIEALYKGDGNQLMQNIDEAAKQGVDWDNLLTETLVLLHQISLLQIVPSAIGDYIDYEERIRYLAQYISPDDIQLFYQILLTGRKELEFAPDKKIGVEMSFLRALAFMPKILTPPLSDNKGGDSLLTSPNKQTDINQAAVVAKVSSPKPTLPERGVPRVEQNTIEQNAIESNTVEQNSSLSPQTSVPVIDIDDNVSDVTKSILVARQQVIEGEKAKKKSEQVELNQPEPRINSNNLTPNNKLNKVDDKARLQTSEQHNSVEVRKEADDITDTSLTAETYQWQFSEHFTPTNDSQLAAKAAKQAFEDEKTAELTQKLIDLSTQCDPWSAEIEQLTLPPLIKQIAINSYLETLDETKVILHLRSALSHLIRSENNLKRLAQLLSVHRGKICEVTAVIDDDTSHATPLEVREKIYQMKLSDAKQLIEQDSKIAMICQIFEARIDEQSIRPV